MKKLIQNIKFILSVFTELKYWKSRCEAAENVIRNSTLKQKLDQLNVSYQPGYYEAREELHRLQNQRS